MWQLIINAVKIHQKLFINFDIWVCHLHLKNQGWQADTVPGTYIPACHNLACHWSGFTDTSAVYKPNFTQRVGRHES